MARRKSHRSGAHSKNVDGFQKKTNPFELRWERRRHNALSKSSKSNANRVNVGAARLASNTKRLSMITADMKSRNKRNKFTDKRIGEYDPNMTEEDRYLARFQKERSRRVVRRAIFNLDGDLEDDQDQLTHGGQPLGFSLLRDDYEDENPLNDERESDPENDEDIKRGGFVAKKSSDYGDGETNNEVPRTHKEIMEEVIRKSKFHKLERQRERAAGLEETEELDANLPQLMELMSAKESEMLGDDVKVEPLVVRADSEEFDYNREYVELAKEARAHTSERLKTKEELAQEEFERLEELEKTRLSRLKGIDDHDDSDQEKIRSVTARHISGDDIKDDFHDDPHTAAGNQLCPSEDFDTESDENGDGNGLPGAALLEEASEGSDSETRDGERNVVENDVGSGTREKAEQLTSASSKTGEKCYVPAPNVATLSEDAIPFVYKSCPQTQGELEVLFKALTPPQRSTVLSRLRRCFALALDPVKNKQALSGLLSALLERVDLAAEVFSSANAVGSSEIAALLPHVHALSEVNPGITLQWARHHVEAGYNQLVLAVEDGTTFSATWSPSVLQTLRAVAKLYPGSDHRHSVTTPLSILLSASLSHANIETVGDRVTGTFVSFILVELLSQAKRHSGELLDFLHDTIFYLVDKLGSDGIRELDKLSAKPIQLADCMMTNDLAAEEDQSIHLRLLRTTLAIIRVAAFGGEARGIKICFSPIVKALEGMKSGPTSALIEDLRRWMANEESSRRPLMLYTRKQADFALKSINVKYEAVDGVYLGKRKNRGPSAELQQLRQKVKKEARSTTRELRRDAAVHQAEIDRIRREEDDRRSRKAREETMWLEEQQQTYKEQVKKVKKITGKRW